MPSLVEVVDREHWRIAESGYTVLDVFALQHAPLVAIDVDARLSAMLNEAIAASTASSGMCGMLFIGHQSNLM